MFSVKGNTLVSTKTINLECQIKLQDHWIDYRVILVHHCLPFFHTFISIKRGKILTRVILRQRLHCDIRQNVKKAAVNAEKKREHTRSWHLI
jgi:hypothetical protein